MSVGAIGAVIGYAWFHIMAFHESLRWGLGCLLVPFVILIFVIMHLEKASKPFAVLLAGLASVGAGFYMTGSQ